jgi:2,3-bisphosphoglycerate-independent phosphoglycerate mutase
MKKPPLLLVVLDGWGERAETEYNAIAQAAPYFHELQSRYPSSLLTACGKEVGLPEGIMGNSEVGHMNLGAGRVVYQDIRSTGCWSSSWKRCALRASPCT